MSGIGQLGRFLLVGACGELLYLAIVLGASRHGLAASQAVALAGVVCMLVNAELHARVSFQSRNSLAKTARYCLIQGVCLLISALLAQLLSALGSGSWLIALTTAGSWASLSFLLTRRLHHAPPRP